MSPKLDGRNWASKAMELRPLGLPQTLSSSCTAVLTRLRQDEPKIYLLTWGIHSSRAVSWDPLSNLFPLALLHPRMRLFLNPSNLAFAAKGVTGFLSFSAISQTAFAAASTTSSAGSGGSCPSSFYDIASETDSAGKLVDFNAFRGKVVYAVNVASK
jgi:hypothetical protein